MYHVIECLSCDKSAYVVYIVTSIYPDSCTRSQKKFGPYYSWGELYFFAVVFDYLPLFYYHLHRKASFAEVIFFS